MDGWSANHGGFLEKPGHKFNLRELVTVCKQPFKSPRFVFPPFQTMAGSNTSHPKHMSILSIAIACSTPYMYMYMYKKSHVEETQVHHRVCVCVCVEGGRGEDGAYTHVCVAGSELVFPSICTLLWSWLTSEVITKSSPRSAASVPH